MYDKLKIREDLLAAQLDLLQESGRDHVPA